MRFSRLFFSGALTLLVLTACTDSAPPEPPSAASAGDQALIELGRRTFRSKGCIQCHMREGVGQRIGPDLDELARRADPTYVRESILDPGAVIVPGYEKLKMPDNYGRLLSEAELDALQYYLSNAL